MFAINDILSTPQIRALLTITQAMFKSMLFVSDTVEYQITSQNSMCYYFIINGQ